MKHCNFFFLFSFFSPDMENPPTPAFVFSSQVKRHILLLLFYHHHLAADCHDGSCYNKMSSVSSINSLPWVRTWHQMAHKQILFVHLWKASLRACSCFIVDLNIPQVLTRLLLIKVSFVLIYSQEQTEQWCSDKANVSVYKEAGTV